MKEELTLAECVKMVRRSEVTQDQFKRSQMEMAKSLEVNKQRYPRCNQEIYTSKRSGNNRRQAEMKENVLGVDSVMGLRALLRTQIVASATSLFTTRGLSKQKIDSDVDVSVMSLSTNENMHKPLILHPTNR